MESSRLLAEDDRGKEKDEEGKKKRDSGDGGKIQEIDDIEENTSCSCLKIMVMIIAILTLVCLDTQYFCFACFKYIKVHYLLLTNNEQF